MNCPFCGAQIPDGAAFCPNCGAPSTPQQAEQQQTVLNGQPQAPGPQYQQQPQAAPDPQYQQQPYTPYQSTVPVQQPISARCRTFGIISFVLGICSIVFCWIGIFPGAGIGLGLFMIACAIVGLVFSGISRRAGQFTLAKLGKIFSIIGLVLSGICWIIGIIMTILVASGEYYWY